MERIVITSDGDTLDSEVSQHFGRCPYFIVLEIAEGRTKAWKAVKNPYFENHVPFAVPDFILKLKPDVLITGGIGPRALQAMEGKTKVIHGFSGTCREAIERYVRNEVESEKNPCEHSNEGANV